MKKFNLVLRYKTSLKPVFSMNSLSFVSYLMKWQFVLIYYNRTNKNSSTVREIGIIRQGINDKIDETKKRKNSSSDPWYSSHQSSASEILLYINPVSSTDLSRYIYITSQIRSFKCLRAITYLLRYVYSV